MSKILQVLEMVLPVLIMIVLGSISKKKNWFDKNGLNGIKAVISKITIPVVLFLAFYSVEYSFKSIVLLVVMFTVCCLALGAGFLTKNLVGNGSQLMPFLLSGYEAGMLGYALFTLLVGAEKRFYFATVDLGQVLFVYTVFLAVLTAKTGGKPTVKSITKNMFTNPAFLGALSGMIFGITGLGKLILASPIENIFTNTLNFIAAPTAAMILIIVGYEISLSKKMLKPVIKTIALRLGVMAILLLLAITVIFAIIPFDKTLLIALIMMFALPAPFIIPLYANVESEGEYISTTLSANTLVTIALFIVLAFYVT